MPTVCTYRPNRTVPRKFNERDAARIMCRVVRSGGSLAKIQAQYRQVCGDQRPNRRSAAMEIALQAEAIEFETNIAFDTMFNFLATVAGLLLVISRIGRTPFTIPLAVAASVARTQVQAVQTTLRVTRAANAARFDIIRREAANEAAFAIRASG